MLRENHQWSHRLCERRAHVRDGYLVQTNIVRQDGKRGALLTVLKNGTTSTLTIVGNVRKKLPFILAGLPKHCRSSRSSTSRYSSAQR